MIAHQNRIALSSVVCGFLLIISVLRARADVFDSAGRPQPPGLEGSFAHVRLKDGRTLCIGGGSGNPFQISPVGQIYDPKTQRFTATGKMVAPRCGPVPILLLDGTVLIVGGGDCSGGPAERVVELYNAESNDFRVVGRLKVARFGLSATLLRNGQVLVAEGIDDQRRLVPQSEVYDPKHRAMRLGGSMVFARCSATRAELTDGTILFAGGVLCNWPPEKGRQSYEVLMTAELYDSKTGAFRRVGDMVEPRVGSVAAIMRDGRVLIVGGRPVYTRFTLNTAEIYDPRSFRFTATGKMTRSRYAPVLKVRMDGDVLVEGGSYVGPPGMDYGIRSTELYDPSTGEFTALPNAP
jgi:hypothetical protein